MPVYNDTQVSRLPPASRPSAPSPHVLESATLARAVIQEQRAIIERLRPIGGLVEHELFAAALLAESRLEAIISSRRTTTL